MRLPDEELAASLLIVCSKVKSIGMRAKDLFVRRIDIIPFSKYSVIPG